MLIFYLRDMPACITSNCPDNDFISSNLCVAVELLAPIAMRMKQRVRHYLQRSYSHGSRSALI